MPRRRVSCFLAHSLLAVGLGGCTAGGQAWVHDAADPGSRPEGSAQRERETSLPAESDGAPITWRRKVITLGERTEVPDEAASAPAPSSPSISVVTTNYYSAGYGAGYGYGMGYGFWPGGGFRPDRPGHGPDPCPEPPSSQTPRLGGDWPAPPSYGPPMMTQTAPADPWR